MDEAVSSGSGWEARPMKLSAPRRVLFSSFGPSPQPGERGRRTKDGSPRLQRFRNLSMTTPRADDFMSRTLINFCLDALPLTITLGLIWTSCLLKFVFPPGMRARSEERRVGKECRA